MSLLEVICILVEIFVFLVVEQARNKASNYTESDSHPQRYKRSCNLESSLPRSSSTVWDVEESARVFSCNLSIVSDFIPEKDDSTPDASQKPRNAVKIVNTTCIIEAYAL